MESLIESIIHGWEGFTYAFHVLLRDSLKYFIYYAVLFIFICMAELRCKHSVNKIEHKRKKAYRYCEAFIVQGSCIMFFVCICSKNPEYAMICAIIAGASIFFKTEPYDSPNLDPGTTSEEVKKYVLLRVDCRRLHLYRLVLYSTSLLGWRIRAVFIKYANFCKAYLPICRTNYDNRKLPDFVFKVTRDIIHLTISNSKCYVARGLDTQGLTWMNSVSEGAFGLNIAIPSFATSFKIMFDDISSHELVHVHQEHINSCLSRDKDGHFSTFRRTLAEFSAHFWGSPFLAFAVLFPLVPKVIWGIKTLCQDEPGRRLFWFCMSAITIGASLWLCWLLKLDDNPQKNSKVT